MKARRLLPLATFVAVLSAVRAHDAFAEYVWHRVEIAAGTRQVDVTLKLTFFEEWSERERRQMDADRDGAISRSEVESYSANLTEGMKSRVTLTVAGQRLALIPLYAPEVDLLG